jgi:hypothetical protein
VGIPQARDELNDIVAGLDEGPLKARLTRVEAMLYRKTPVRVAPRQLRDFDADTAAEVRAYARANPVATQMQIATKFNTNPGRVSEALNNLR